MKDSLIDSITKITNYIKAFITKTETDLKFEGNKSKLIKVMYNSLLEQKSSEINALTVELNKIKKKQRNLLEQITRISNENSAYERKIEALSTFQHFWLNNQ